MAPQASTPKPPAFEIADTRLRSETQVIAPPRRATRQPSSAVPARHSRARRSRPIADRLSGAVKAVGSVQGAQRQLGIGLVDQDADLDLRGRDRLDVDVS